MKLEGQTNQLTLAPRNIHPGHYLLHALSGSLVFGLGILADYIVGEIRYCWPHRVIWVNGEVQTGYRLRTQDYIAYASRPGSIIELGMTEDGIVVWRIKK